MDTVEELSPMIAPYVGASGVCGDQAQILERINECRRLLWNKGDWLNTLDWLCIRCVGDCLVLPSQYKQIRVAYINNSPASLKNDWYETVYGIGKGDCNGIIRSLVEVGTTPVFREYTKAPFQIRAYCERIEDEGTEISILVKRESGVVEKEVIALTTQPQETNKSCVAILAVVKPVTAGRVRLYAVNKDFNEKLLIAVYLPSDANPVFRKFKVKSQDYPSLTIRAKKKYSDLVAGSDLVEFNTDAMIFASMAINFREARDNNQFMSNLTLAVAELNRDIADEEIMTASPMRISWTPENYNLIT
jgi:hypothetical protein